MKVGVSLQAPNELGARITVECRVGELRSMEKALNSIEWSQRGAPLRKLHDELLAAIRLAEGTVWGEDAPEDEDNA